MSASDMVAGEKVCAVCGGPVELGSLELQQIGERIDLCSFECLIEFAVSRIRQRREFHNRQLAELREQLRIVKPNTREQR